MIRWTPVRHNLLEHQNARPFEPFNGAHILGYMMQQPFMPTSESQSFSHEDADQVFRQIMLSTDDSIPQQELVRHYR